MIRLSRHSPCLIVQKIAQGRFNVIKTQIEHTTQLHLIAPLSLDDANVRHMQLENRGRGNVDAVQSSPASLTQSGGNSQWNSIKSAENSHVRCVLLSKGVLVCRGCEKELFCCQGVFVCFFVFQGGQAKLQHPIAVSEVKTHPCPSLFASLFLSAALCGLLAVPKSFQSKCKFHQPPTKKTDISIKANVLRLCRVDVSLSIASPVRKPANLHPLLRMDLSFLSLSPSFSLFMLLFFSPPPSSCSLSHSLSTALFLSRANVFHFDPSVFP